MGLALYFGAFKPASADEQEAQINSVKLAVCLSNQMRRFDGSATLIDLSWIEIASTNNGVLALSPFPNTCCVVSRR